MTPRTLDPEDLEKLQAEVDRCIARDLAALNRPGGVGKEVIHTPDSNRGPVRIGEVVGEVLTHILAANLLGPRYPVIRTGERPEIPRLVRVLVYARDAGTCKLCGARSDLQLDHVIPWSAGGPDTSNNLRILCELCNTERSNYWHGSLPRVFPVTAACDHCLREHGTRYRRHGNEKFPLYEACPECLGWPYSLGSEYRTPGWCGSCGLMSYVSDPNRLL